MFESLVFYAQKHHFLSINVMKYQNCKFYVKNGKCYVLMRIKYHLTI